MRSQEWVTVPIRDVYLEFHDGLHATPKPSDIGQIYLGIDNLREDGRLDFSETKHISNHDFERWTRRVTPESGDVVFTYEATLHRYAVIPEGFRGCLGRRVALIRPNPEVVDSHFLLYYFLSPDWYGTVRSNVNTGSTVDRIPLVAFPDFLIRVPPLVTQRRIACILSSYDNLIENNRRRIQILEEMARAIYLEWFVHFRFPGLEEVEMVDSEMGEIPEGWTQLPFTSLAEFQNGYAFAPKHWQKEGKPIVKIAEMKDGIGGTTSYYHGDDIPENYHIATGDLLFAWSASLCVRFWTGGDALLNQHIFRVLPKNGFSRAFLFHSIQTKIADFQSRTQGTTMRHIRRSALDEVHLPVPPNECMSKFDALVVPMTELRIKLEVINKALSRIRDLLLPKLVSGEIDVSYLETEAAPPNTHQTSKYKGQSTIDQWTDGVDQDADMGR